MAFWVHHCFSDNSSRIPIYAIREEIMKRRSLAFAALGIGLLLSVAAKAEDIRAAMEAANAQFDETFNKGDATAVAALYTPDAQVLSPGKIANGTAEISKLWEDLMKAGIRDHKLQLISAKGEGKFAYESAKWTVSGPGKDGGRKSYSGTTAKILQKQSDGTWKAQMHIWNMDPES
jgi:uncharacterized protein (TIGR02246 family)